MAKEKIYLFDHSPHLRDEWDYAKNANMDAESVTYGSKRLAWWLCQEGHSWEYSIGTRARFGVTCGYCTGRLVTAGVNDLLTLFPDVAYQWSKRNPMSASQIHAKSGKVFWWVCAKGHEWEAKVITRTKVRSGCPYCRTYYPIVGESDLESCRPDIAKDWSPRNSKTPREYTVSSNKTVWWVCVDGHEWESSINNRTGKSNKGCPYCSGHRAVRGVSDLLTVNPILAGEWSDRNHKRPDDTLPKSNIKVWWRCSQDHEWEAAPYSRTAGNGCPRCNKTGTSRQETTLRSLLSESFEVLNDDHTHRLGIPWRNNQSMQVDIELLYSNLNVVVEYDGSYFHYGKEILDGEKTLALLSSGYLVVRLREQSIIRLPHIDIDHQNLLQLSITYSREEDHLIEAVEQIKQWLDEKTQK